MGYPAQNLEQVNCDVNRVTQLWDEQGNRVVGSIKPVNIVLRPIVIGSYRVLVP